ncbi:MAG: hypothetical protein M0Z51_08205 [Propionibacterium sp.]|nr:hypothetical protein [Propionibacterium sp.]
MTAATTALPDVAVFDGAATEMAEGPMLFVGVDDPEITSWVAASSTQEWALATMTARNEQVTITCAVSTYAGDLAMKTPRDQAFSIAGTVQGLLRDPATFASISGLLFASYEKQTFRQYHDGLGSWCLLTFQLEFKARI